MGTWLDVQNAIDNSNRNIKVLKGKTDIGKNVCQNMHIPENSLLATIVCNTQGIIIDNWIKILGQPDEGINGIDFYNNIRDFIDKFTGLFVVAIDVVGGIFAINITRFEAGINDIYYFAPDTLEWECMEIQYNQFLAWTFSEKVDQFYSSMRWHDWKKDCEIISIDEGILLYPFLWAKECDVETASKKVVPLNEIISMNFEFYDKI